MDDGRMERWIDAWADSSTPSLLFLSWVCGNFVFITPSVGGRMSLKAEGRDRYCTDMLQSIRGPSCTQRVLAMDATSNCNESVNSRDQASLGEGVLVCVFAVDELPNLDRVLPANTNIAALVAFYKFLLNTNFAFICNI